MATVSLTPGSSGGGSPHKLLSFEAGPSGAWMSQDTRGGNPTPEAVAGFETVTTAPLPCEANFVNMYCYMQRSFSAQ